MRMNRVHRISQAITTGVNVAAQHRRQHEADEHFPRA